MNNAAIKIDTEKQLISINDGAKKQYYIVLFLCIMTTFNGTIFSLTNPDSFLSKLGASLVILGIIMLGFFFFKLNYQDTIAFSEIDSFFIKKNFGKDQPIFKLKNGKIRRIFKPISKEVSRELKARFNK